MDPHGHGIAQAVPPQPYDAHANSVSEKSKKQDGPWQSSEDKALRDAIQACHGPLEHRPQHLSLKWSEISSICFLKDCRRDAKQCRERWVNHLDPNVDHSSLTTEEGHRILNLVNTIGKKWADIGRRMKKPENSIKNWYYQHRKHQDRQSRPQDQAASHDFLPEPRSYGQYHSLPRQHPLPGFLQPQHHQLLYRPASPPLNPASRRLPRPSPSFSRSGSIASSCSNPSLTDSGSPIESSPDTPYTRFSPTSNRKEIRISALLN